MYLIPFEINTLRIITYTTYKLWNILKRQMRLWICHCVVWWNPPACQWKFLLLPEMNTARLCISNSMLWSCEKILFSKVFIGGAEKLIIFFFMWFGSIMIQIKWSFIFVEVVLKINPNQISTQLLIDDNFCDSSTR